MQIEWIEWRTTSSDEYAIAIHVIAIFFLSFFYHTLHSVLEIGKNTSLIIVTKRTVSSDICIEYIQSFTI